MSIKLSTTTEDDDLDLLSLINSRILPSINHRHNLTSVSFFNDHPNPSGSLLVLEVRQTIREPEEMIRTSRICDIPLEMAVDVIAALEGGKETDEAEQEWDEVVLTLDLREIVLTEGDGKGRCLRDATTALLKEGEGWMDGPEMEVVVLVASEDVKKVVDEVVAVGRGKGRRARCRVVLS